jgi:hypothetical protein
MKRLAITCTVTSAVILILGVVDWATNYNWAQGDQDPLFGNPRILLNDGMTVIIAGGFLLVGSAIMWVVALRREHGNQRQL